MSAPEPPVTGDLPYELRFALAEGDAIDAPSGLRERVLGAASAARSGGRPVAGPPRISGLEGFRRIVTRFGELLAELSDEDWARPSIRGLDVQGVVGHLVGVEEGFLAVLTGEADPSVGSDHIASTQSAALRQTGQRPAGTLREWSACSAATLAALADRDLLEPCAFYGTTMSLEQLLDTRAFELWTHDEDIRRATGRLVADPDPSALARMVDVAVALLPLGVSLAGRSRPDATARLVLTGPSGGTWDVTLDGRPAVGRADARVVVDAASFCRLVNNRADAAGAGALVDGALDVADDLLVGAAALALD